MQHQKRILLLMTCAINFCICSYSYAHKDDKIPVVISKTNTAIYSFNVSVGDIELSSYYNIDKKIKDDFYKIITESLKSVNGLNLKPLNFLAGKIDFDDDGYPISRGKKAVATNSADNYINISISFAGAGMIKPADESNPKDCILSKKVAVRLDVTVFDKLGEKVFDEKATAKSENKVDFHYSKFSIGKLAGTSPKQSDTKILYELLKQATAEMSNEKFPK